MRRYILADRFEEITDPEHMRVDPACDRTIYLYGYNRGTYMRAGQRIHVPGVGDFQMDDVSVTSCVDNFATGVSQISFLIVQLCYLGFLIFFRPSKKKKIR